MEVPPGESVKTRSAFPARHGEPRHDFYAAGKVIYNLLDGHTVAVDAKSGRELWKTQVADVADGETVTMAHPDGEEPRDRGRLGR